MTSSIESFLRGLPPIQASDLPTWKSLERRVLSQLEVARVTAQDAAWRRECDQVETLARSHGLRARRWRSVADPSRMSWDIPQIDSEASEAAVAFWQDLVLLDAVPEALHEVLFSPVHLAEDSTRAMDGGSDMRPVAYAEEMAALAAARRVRVSAERLCREFCAMAKAWGRDVGPRVAWRLVFDEERLGRIGKTMGWWNPFFGPRRAIGPLQRAINSETNSDQIPSSLEPLYAATPATLMAHADLGDAKKHDMLREIGRWPTGRPDPFRPLVNLWSLGVAPLEIDEKGFVLGIPETP